MKLVFDTADRPSIGLVAIGAAYSRNVVEQGMPISGVTVTTILRRRPEQGVAACFLEQ